MKRDPKAVLSTPFLAGVPNVKVLRSKRRTISAEINRKGEVVVRCPAFLPEAEIERFLYSRKEWIEAHYVKYQQRMSLDKAGDPGSPSAQKNEWTAKELSAIRKQAAPDLKARVEYWAKVLGVTYGIVSIRTQRTRWGSCSSQGNISLNALLVLMDEELRDYTVVHELCHRRHMDHSAAFWAEVGKVLPDYRKLRQRLKEEGALLIARLP